MPYKLLAILFFISSQSSFADKRYEQKAIKKSKFNQMITSKTDKKKVKRIKKSKKMIMVQNIRLTNQRSIIKKFN